MMGFSKGYRLQVTGYRLKIEKLKGWKIGELKVTGCKLAFWAEIAQNAFYKQVRRGASDRNQRLAKGNHAGVPGENFSKRHKKIVCKHTNFYEKVLYLPKIV
jgi:hypothetical protein